MHERCERHPKSKRHTKKKESETLSETDGLCSSEHGLRGVGFGGSPIGYAGFMSCFKVQGNFLLLCSSSNFVGYSYHTYGIFFQILDSKMPAGRERGEMLVPWKVIIHPSLQ